MGPYFGPFKNALESPRPSPKYPMKNKAAWARNRRTTLRVCWALLRTL
jgi:hypothetical protein